MKYALIIYAPNRKQKFFRQFQTLEGLFLAIYLYEERGFLCTQ